MKKLAASLLIAFVFLNSFALSADQIYDDIAAGIKSRFGFDMPQNQNAKIEPQSVWTNVYAYQYTNDGWLQLLAVYSDSIIFTNLEGPREGLQMIIMSNGALMDMCHNYTQYSDHATHQYSWGEVNTYTTYQVVNFR